METNIVEFIKRLQMIADNHPTAIVKVPDCPWCSSKIEDDDVTEVEYDESNDFVTINHS